VAEHAFGRAVFGANPPRCSRVWNEEVVDFAERFLKSPPTHWQTTPLPELPAEEPPLAQVPRALQGIVAQVADLVPLLQDPATSWRREFLIEHWKTEDEPLSGVWTGLRTRDFKYVEYGATGEREFYDLRTDPYELTNAIRSGHPEINRLQRRLAALKGLAITTPPIAPEGHVGREYFFPLKAWGGTLPYTWRVHEDSPNPLPPGLALQPTGIDTAAITGIPIRAANAAYPIWIVVRDHSVAKLTRQPQEYVLEFSLHIKPLPLR